MSIIRVIHNRENPYVQLNKNALWNKNLSLKAIGLWARCLSRPDDWSFNVNEMASSMKEGRRAIYSAIDELIKEGYAMRLEHSERGPDGGKFIGGGTEYIFFEFPPTEEEKQKCIEEFKKSFRQCGFGNRRNGDLRNAPLLKKEEELNKEQTEPRPTASPPPQAAGIVNRLLQAILKIKPDFKQRDLSGWVKEIELMLKRDNRSVEAIEKVIDWLPSSSFWSKNVLSAAALRKQFDRLELEMKDVKKVNNPDNIELINKLSLRKDLILSGKVIVGEDYVEFPGIYDGYYKINESSFKEKVINGLRKIGVPIK